MVTGRRGEQYLIPSCPLCSRAHPPVEITGGVRKVLFKHQQGVTQGRPRFNVATHGHEEAEVRCAECGGRFWTVSPVAVAEARDWAEREGEGGVG